MYSSRERVGHSAGEQLVENHTQRIHVAARIQRKWIALHLLRAHVCQRPDNHADVCLPRRLRVGIGETGYTEIQNLRLARFIHENVGRLQVTMDQAALMGMLHRIADSGHQFQPLPCIQMMIVAIGEQRLTTHQLHGEVRLFAKRSVRGSRFVDLGNPRMLQPPQRLRLVLEAAQHLASGRSCPDHLQRNCAMRTFLFRLVHRAHSALAQKAKNPIMSNAWGQRLPLIRTQGVCRNRGGK